jgi:hypothetical protein
MKLILIIISLITLGNALDFLENNNAIKLEFEFSFRCGNSYLAKKDKVKAIVNDIIKTGKTIEFKIHSYKFGDDRTDGYFTIYRVYDDDRKIKIATSNPDSALYYKALDDAPFKPSSPKVINHENNSNYENVELKMGFLKRLIDTL